jgi:hypothetical protein
MPSILKEIVFSEPARGYASIIKEGVVSEPSRGLAVMWLSGSLVLSSQYVYYWILGDSPPLFAIIFSVGFALSGIAESLPKNRRRETGIFRVTAILVLMSLTVGAFFELEILI